MELLAAISPRSEALIMYRDSCAACGTCPLPTFNLQWGVAISYSRVLALPYSEC